MEINVIVACDLKNGIAKNDCIPWRCSDDLKRFKTLTMGHTLLMGRKTFETVKDKLKGRKLVVVSKTLSVNSTDPNVFVFSDLNHTIKFLAKTTKTLWVIGGGEIYSQILNSRNLIVNNIYLTRIHDTFNCDTFFPIIESNWNIDQVSEKCIDSKHGTVYQYIKYVKSATHDTSEYPYLWLLSKILNDGKKRPDRTGTGTIGVFGEQLRFSIRNVIPIITSKQMAWKTCIKELLWFMRGDTNANHLKEQGVHIWNGNTTREFLDARGLTDLNEGDIGAGYGFQWRHFGAEYKGCDKDYRGQGVDQLQYVIDTLKTDPYNRRIFMSAWNPQALDRMALPPCHVSVQFYVELDHEGNKLLSCHMYQRSVDCFLGLPFNIMSYATLTHLLAMWCDMIPSELIISMGDTHIYLDHIDQVYTQLGRTPYALPRLVINPGVKQKKIEEVSIDDFSLIEYHSHPSIKAKMSA